MRACGYGIAAFHCFGQRPCGCYARILENPRKHFDFIYWARAGANISFNVTEKGIEKVGAVIIDAGNDSIKDKLNPKNN